uniref:DNA 5'-3' helicase n=1 Tax=Tetraselmis sp. GSL018 TaxID=582737 RepID=A0A061RL20_9CHLO
MKFSLEGLTVYFPYEYIYPEQYRYMLELKRALDAKGHSCIEMPTGTGKTITLLSLITSYQLAHPEVGKLIYCTRTVPEMEKVLAELKELIEYRNTHLSENPPPILATGLSSRKNMCVHPTVSEEGTRESVDSKCRQLTATWVRERATENPDIELCEFFEGHEKAGGEALLPPGVYTLHDIRQFGREKGWCPYFLARHMIAFSNVIVYNYQYMLDPKVSQMVSRDLERECIVVFDEAHNIDNVCIEALSINLRRNTLEGAQRNITRLQSAVERAKATDAERLKNEYQKLVSGLVQQGALPQAPSDELLQTPVLPEDVLRETVPGHMRRAEHFLAFMKRFVQFLRMRLSVQQVETETPVSFLDSLQQSVSIDGKTLRFCYDRLQVLMRTLEITNTDEYMPIQLVADFGTLVGTYAKGFAIIIEPYDERMPNVPDPVMQLACLDASLAMKPVFQKYQSVVITSGTLSPIDLYPKLLSFHPVAIQSLNMTLTRDCICPVVLTRGSDQMPVSTKFEMRSDPGVVRNYGKMLVELASVVPDGIVCFFVSYLYMDQIITSWHEMGILQEITQHKLVFIETQDVVETTLALDNFRRACDRGRGAMFFSVARGKVAEGIDFDRHYGRAVVMFGVPYQYTLSRILRARLEYLRETFQIKENDFLAFDAVRQAAQCVGRVIRSKADYGLMIFADKRYQRHDKRDKLPGWINSYLKDAHLNLSTDMLVHVSREFMRNMAQPYDKGEVGKSLLSEAAVNALAAANGG